MAIFELYSKRQKKLRGEVPDVYIYDEIPNTLRVQIIHIWKDVIGGKKQYTHEIEKNYEIINDILCREYGVFQLTTTTYDKNTLYKLADFFLKEEDIEIVIDIIELSFKVIKFETSKNNYLNRYDAEKIAKDGIKELNNRFKEHGIGYQFIENKIMRIDSELIHTEAVKPALRLLNEKDYKGAQEEFLSAYEHYRHGKNKEALNDCLKSFESTMKSIIDKHGWEVKKNATAQNLIQVCFDNNLIPSFWQTQVTALRTMLESAIPTGRNNLSGHGQGSELTTVPDYLVSYMLHMTASTLVFLTTAEKDMDS